MEKALEETAKELEKTEKKAPVKPAETSKVTSSAYKGVPQFLLDKVCLYSVRYIGKKKSFVLF